MSYEYTDEHGQRFHVANSESGKRVKVQMGGDIFPVRTYFKHEDAPAVALAILEAAGYGSDNRLLGDGPFESADAALINLQEHIKEVALAAHQEAEDAKVRDFMRAILPGAYQTDQSVTDGDRERYRAAREFFAKEANDAR